MPVSVTYPGVYIEELPSAVRTITGVATSITAFIGSAVRGPLNDPMLVQSYAEFERSFGGLSRSSAMSYAVNQFFQNGGRDALIVRVSNGDAALLDIGTGVEDELLSLVAANAGQWGNHLRVRIDHNTRPQVGEEQLFNLSVRDTVRGVTERFQNVSVLPGHPRVVNTVLEQESVLIRISGELPASRPVATPDAAAGQDPLEGEPGSLALSAGTDGSGIGPAQISAPALEAAREGIWALEKADIFNLLCIPPFSLTPVTSPGDVVDVDAATRTAAAAYCERRRAMYIVDPLMAWSRPSDVIDGLDSVAWGMARSNNAAVYFPRLRQSDSLQEGRLADFAPSGAIAGVISRIDAQRGLWKTPAGIEANLNGVAELTAKLTDGENGQLNPLGINCLRSFPVTGRVVWGGRTLVGADILASQWKYLSVRRTALFIEESLYRGTQWVVFEPNDEPLWAQIRLNLGAFMQTLFRQGAFQGSTPKETYFVKCSSETTTQNDIDNGIVNILVGFAPLKPAEFVVIKISQIAGQIEA